MIYSINLIGSNKYLFIYMRLSFLCVIYFQCLNNNFIIVMRCLANEILPWLESALFHMPEGLQSMKLNGNVYVSYFKMII